jgi:hypothetical protein
LYASFSLQEKEDGWRAGKKNNRRLEKQKTGFRKRSALLFHTDMDIFGGEDASGETVYKTSFSLQYM